MCTWRPSMRLSRTVMPRKRAMFWKVRATPRSATLNGGMCVTSSPPRLILPLSGGKKPLIMFSSVVLPAPLGPITESRSPSLTSTLTRLTACTPPNDFDTSRTSRRALMRSREPALAPAVVLHVAVALALPDAGEPQIELLDVLVVAHRPGLAGEHNAARLHHIAVLGVLEGDGGVLLGEQHGYLLVPVQPAHDLENLG